MGLFTWRMWLLPVAIFALASPLWLHWFEPAMFIYLNTLCAPVAAPVWTALSLLGNGWGVLGVTAPLLVLAPRLMWAWLCAAPFAIVFARTGKFLLEAPRPAALVDNAHMRIVGETLHNVAMPSGHTLTAFAAAAALFFALPAVRRGRHLWLFALALGVGLSRMAVGAHWPADVAMGAVLGLLSGLCGARLCAQIPARHQQVQSWLTRVLAVLGLYAMLVLLTDPMGFVQNMPVQVVLAGFLGLNIVIFFVKTFKPLTPTGAP